MSYTLTNLSALERNAMQVAIDDLIEFKRELIISEILSNDDEVLESQHDHIERLRSALKVKAKLDSAVLNGRTKA